MTVVGSDLSGLAMAVVSIVQVLPLWLNLLVLAVGLIVLCFFILAAYGEMRWDAESRNLSQQLFASVPESIEPRSYKPEELITLPAPVQRYFRTVLTPDQPLITAVRCSQSGAIRLQESSESWNRFTATQIVVPGALGFDWNAAVGMVPGVIIYVHDAFVAGEGRLFAKVLGLFTVVDTRGTPEIAEGELMRYLAEAVWYPTAVLPSQGVRWQAIDDSRATAELTVGETTVSLTFEFDTEGLISSVQAASRYRDVEGKPVPTPWQAQFRSYEIREGIRIPMEAEVAWELPTGMFSYWRGRISQISYEFAQGQRSDPSGIELS